MQEQSLAGLNVLVLEDEPLLRKQMVASLERLGADVAAAGTIAVAERLFTELAFDFAIMDVNLPDGLSTDLLKKKTIPANTGIIVMTAEADVAGAVNAMKLGALDYLAKPFDCGELPLIINRARRARQSVRLNEQRREKVDRAGEIFFFGEALVSVERQLQKILEADARLQGALPPVLIQGETGTGKTTVARWIHNHGPRAAQPLVEVNCSALPETLAESELFGHERGAFTDAKTARMGLFEAANGGTLFLDELPSLSLPLQAKVLTVIEDHKVRRVGGTKPIAVDVRLLAATNLSLTKAIEEKKFREDLYHRLDLFRITIPPLRERGADIVKLAELMALQICQRHRLPEKKISEQGKRKLLRYPWPGNVRELAHELERSLVFEEGETLNLDRLAVTGDAEQTDAKDWLRTDFVFPEEGFSLENGINRLIKKALQQTNNNVSAAARVLGVSRDYIRYRLDSDEKK